MKNMLYHYCSTESFFNIIKSAKLWLSDVGKSNDWEECVLCYNEIKKRVGMLLPPANQEAWNFGCDMSAKLNEDIRIYCFCLSEKCDSLGQWRGYGNDGKGISIGFRKDVLAQLHGTEDGRKYFLDFDRVIYDESEKNAYIDKLVFANIDLMDRKKSGYVGLELSNN